MHHGNCRAMQRRVTQVDSSKDSRLATLPPHGLITKMRSTCKLSLLSSEEGTAQAGKHFLPTSDVRGARVRTSRRHLTSSLREMQIIQTDAKMDAPRTLRTLKSAGQTMVKRKVNHHCRSGSAGLNRISPVKQSKHHPYPQPHPKRQSLERIAGCIQHHHAKNVRRTVQKTKIGRYRLQRFAMRPIGAIS